jgi:hypothetical protein
MANTHTPASTDFPAGLSQPAHRALAGAGIQNLEQLATFSEAQIKQLHGMGPKGIDLLRQALTQKACPLPAVQRNRKVF